MKTKMKKAYMAICRWMQNPGNQKALVCMVMMFGVMPMFADTSAGTGAFKDIANTISQYQGAVEDIIYAIAAIIALVGAFNIFNKMNNGDQDVKKTAMLVIGGCIALVALAQALPKFFT